MSVVKTVRHIFRRYLDLGSLNLLLTDEAEKRTRLLPYSRAQTIATLSRMQNEIRNDTPEGKAIADAYKKLLNDDPKQDSDTKNQVHLAKLV